MAHQSILVIDDEAVWHRLLARVLGELDYNVYAASSCAKGVRLAEQHMPDCIVLDFHLKDGDAVSVCTALKAGKTSAKIPVIVFSSDPGAEIPAYAECKAAYFIEKGPRLITNLPVIIRGVLAPVFSPDRL